MGTIQIVVVQLTELSWLVSNVDFLAHVLPWIYFIFSFRPITFFIIQNTYWEYVLYVY
jgi:hypothetical protein